MGYTSWDSRSYASYADTIKTKSTREVFASRSIKKYMDPMGVLMRESRDSEQHPESTAIILGLDVTGSMGIIADAIAREQLGVLVENILDRKPVSDPHIMIMGIGDVNCDSAPLQVTQYEPDIRIAEQLQDIWLEGGGGGNTFESYDLPWYFAAQRTSIDCFEKRGKKGYLFTFGDELPPDGVTKADIKRVFGNDEQRGYTAAELLEMAEQRYQVFHIVVEQGSFCRRDGGISVKAAWRELLGGRAVMLSNYKHLADVVTAVIEVSEGADPEAVVASYQDKVAREVVRHALFD